jgi:hypothetical protein
MSIFKTYNTPLQIIVREILRWIPVKEIFKNWGGFKYSS